MIKNKICGILAPSKLNGCECASTVQTNTCWHALQATASLRKVFGSSQTAVSKQDVLARSAVGMVYRTFSPKNCIAPRPKAQRALFVDATQHRHCLKMGLNTNSALRRGAAPVRPSVAVGWLSTPSVKLTNGHMDQSLADMSVHGQNVALNPNSSYARALHPLHRLVFSSPCAREEYRGQLTQQLIPMPPERPHKAPSKVSQVATAPLPYACSTKAVFLPAHEFSAQATRKQCRAQCPAHDCPVSPEASYQQNACLSQSDCFTACSEAYRKHGTGTFVPIERVSSLVSHQCHTRPCIGELATPISTDEADKSGLEQVHCKSNMLSVQTKQEWIAPAPFVLGIARVAHKSIPPPSNPSVVEEQRQCTPWRTNGRFTRQADTMDVEAPQAFEADGEHDVVAWNGVPEDQSLEDERDAPVSGLITSGPLEHPAELLDSAHILPKSLNVASAEPHCDLDSEDALSLTDSMVPSSIDTCSSPTADWPEDTAGNLSSHMDDALTVTVDISTLTAASGIASHPLLLTNRSSVSPDVYIPRAEHVTTSGSCPDSEMRMSDWESVADAACTDAGIASVTDCVAGQVSSLVPDENDRLVSGRRILGNRYVVEKVVGEVCRNTPMMAVLHSLQFRIPWATKMALAYLLL